MINNKYYESYIKFWIPILKKQYFKAKMTGNMNAILTIKENIWKNWHLNTKQKKEVWKLLGAKE